MSDWRTFALGDLTENLDSFRKPVKEGDRKTGPYPYYGASGIVDHVDAYLFDGLHLLIAEDGENLRTRKLPIAFVANGKFWVNNHAHIVRGNDKADTRFLHYALQVADVTSYLTGSTMPKLTQGNLNRIPIYAPKIEEQRAIVNVLSALDDRIELNQRVNETLEQMAQMIFKDWFVDFGPVRRMRQGEINPVAIMGGLVQDTARATALVALFPVAFGDGGIPDGWRWKPLREVLEINPRERLKKGNIAPYSDMASLPTTGPIANAPVMREFGSGMRFRNGDALMARITPCLENGKAAYVDFLADGQVGWGSTEFIVFRAKPPIPSPFAYLLTRQEDFRSHAIQSMTGTSGRQRAQETAIGEYRIVGADPGVYSAFGAFVMPFFRKIRANAIENGTLAEARDYLLPKLMSGEVSVRDAVSQIEDVRP
jgi:type I restriction enzyme S subunit